MYNKYKRKYASDEERIAAKKERRRIKAEENNFKKYGRKIYKHQDDESRKQSNLKSWRNSEKKKAWNKENTRFKISLCNKVKELFGCAICKNNDSRVLVFHHRNPEEKSFSLGNCKNKRLHLIILEIDKCDVLCENCHRIHHFTGKTFNSNSNYIRDNYTYVCNLKEENGCKNCGLKDFRCLDFHHLNPIIKDSEISRLIRSNRDKLDKEISKCEILCSNCHKLKHCEVAINV